MGIIGIVSLLGGETWLQIRSLQQHLQAVLGREMPPFHPHLTFVVGEGGLDRKVLTDRIAALAASTAPFPIQAAGLGIFSAQLETLYLPVPRGPTLAAVQAVIYQSFAHAGGRIQGYYRLENWLPHVTLAHDAPAAKLVPEALRQLPVEGYNSYLSGFSLVETDAGGQLGIMREFPFRGLDALGANPFGLTSRPCQPSDREFVYRVVEGTLRPLVSAYHTWDPARFEDNFVRSWRDKLIVLAAQQGRPVGVVSFDPTPDDHLYINNLYLQPAAHGRGWGGWLLSWLERQSKGRPVRLHVWENNPAVGFYQRHGYRIVETEGHKHLMEKQPPAHAGR